MVSLTKSRKARPAQDDETDVADSIDALLTDVDDADDADGMADESRSDRKKVAPWTRVLRGARQKRKSWSNRAPRDAAQWTAGSGFATKATTGLLVVAIGAGVVAFAQNVFESDAPVQQASSGFDQRMMNRQSAANEVATQFLPAWLSASRESSTALARWWPAVGELDLPIDPTFASDVSVVRTVAAAPGVWTVTVGADVAAAADQNQVTRRYYQVPVAVSGSTNVAAKPLALPAEIPPPGTAVPDVSVTYPTRVSPSSAAMTTTRGFLTALLAGQGDIRLYERPGTWIPPISPAPAQSVTVTSLVADNDSAPSVVGSASPATGQTASVLATVRLTTDQQSRTTQYALRLTARDGRWEVVSVTAPPATTVTEPSTGGASS